ncbi:uncharacterized protein [Blastocystis hominis]|uniref:Uncharacterized protein n=1 Tax=Blastocystis hominis TaxID=12968 RepID=D8MBQ8_BLAHO|nr:uncharacterized protein [Blastocystis hominis]CBK25497.2 unnamed protein product [Blastocystis hominis]|eukprot:XP_012899545.1 uncharacterized protein [Blastocystis hominis]
MCEVTEEKLSEREIREYFRKLLCTQKDTLSESNPSAHASCQSPRQKRQRKKSIHLDGSDSEIYRLSRSKSSPFLAYSSSSQLLFFSDSNIEPDSESEANTSSAVPREKCGNASNCLSATIPRGCNNQLLVLSGTDPSFVHSVEQQLEGV